MGYFAKVEVSNRLILEIIHWILLAKQFLIFIFVIFFFSLSLSFFFFLFSFFFFLFSFFFFLYSLFFILYSFLFFLYSLFFFLSLSLFLFLFISNDQLSFKMFLKINSGVSSVNGVYPFKNSNKHTPSDHKSTSGPEEIVYLIKRK